MNPVTEALQPFIGQWETNPRLGISGNRSRTWGWIFLMLWMHCFRLLCIRGFCGFDFSYQLHPLHSFILFITLVYTYIYYIYNYIYISKADHLEPRSQLSSNGGTPQHCSVSWHGSAKRISHGRHALMSPIDMSHAASSDHSSCHFLSNTPMPSYA